MRNRGAITFPTIDENPPDGPIPIDPPEIEHMTVTDQCWCQPQIIDTLPDGRVIVHRRTMD